MIPITYYAMPISPWTYLGHDRLRSIAAAAGASITLKIMDLGQVFAVSGGLPLGQRPAQRQAYRLQELARWRDALQLPLTVKPKFFPANPVPASLITLHLRDTMGTAAALDFLGAALKTAWAQEGNIADEAQLAALLTTLGHAASMAQTGQNEDSRAALAKDTADAIAAQVFGSPTYAVGDQLYWGQDRLEFVERALAK